MGTSELINNDLPFKNINPSLKLRLTSFEIQISDPFFTVSVNIFVKNTNGVISLQRTLINIKNSSKT